MEKWKNNVVCIIKGKFFYWQFKKNRISTQFMYIIIKEERHIGKYQLHVPNRHIFHFLTKETVLLKIFCAL